MKWNVRMLLQLIEEKNQKIPKKRKENLTQLERLRNDLVTTFEAQIQLLDRKIAEQTNLKNEEITEVQQTLDARRNEREELKRQDERLLAA